VPLIKLARLDESVTERERRELEYKKRVRDVAMTYKEISKKDKRGR